MADGNGQAAGIALDTGTPRFEGVALADVVRACHDTTIDQGLAGLAVPGLERASLEPLLTYCAEVRCAADGVVCAGCRRQSELAGIDSLEAFIARYGEIVIGDGAIRIGGGGEGRLTIDRLDTLVRGWAGEEYWFWARRVLRKLRHGVRRAGEAGLAAAAEGETPAIVLMEPQLPDNIGMVARAMANFGLDTLRLVNPRDGWPNERARVAASGANYVIDAGCAYDTLSHATGDLNWYAATTARQRDLRKPVLTPEQAAAELRRRIGEGQRCGVLFGRERNGLETDEVANADAIVMIPVDVRFASLNLAQAVLILGYAWMQSGGEGSLGRVTTYERPLSAGLRLGDDRPATKAELEGFFEHIESELARLGFFNPPHRRTVVSRNLRSMFQRMAPTEQEVRTLRGIVATLAHGKGSGRKQGD